MHDTCIELLKDGIEGLGTSTTSTVQGQDLLQSRLGEMYMMNEQYQEAITCFHTALSSNPHNAEVKRLMDKLEHTVRGEGHRGDDMVDETVTQEQFSAVIRIDQHDKHDNADYRGGMDS